MYGQTEASPRMSCVPSDRLLEKLGSVGLAMPGGRLSIIDGEGRPLPAGETGGVVYEGPNVMMGYATCRTDLPLGDTTGGRIETGDLGRLDAEGFLFLSGRAARFAKIAGLRLSLDDMERQLPCSALSPALISGSGSPWCSRAMCRRGPRSRQEPSRWPARFPQRPSSSGLARDPAQDEREDGLCPCEGGAECLSRSFRRRPIRCGRRRGGAAAARPQRADALPL